MGAVTIGTTCGRTTQFSYRSMKRLEIGFNGNGCEIILSHELAIAMAPNA
jgi:hypothetical protein